MKWGGLIGIGVAAITIWSLFFIMVFEDREKSPVYSESYSKVQEEAFQAESETDDENVDNDSNDSNNELIEADEIKSESNIASIEKKIDEEIKSYTVREGDAIGYGEGISVETLLLGLNSED